MIDCSINRPDVFEFKTVDFHAPCRAKRYLFSGPFHVAVNEHEVWNSFFVPPPGFKSHGGEKCIIAFETVGKLEICK